MRLFDEERIVRSGLSLRDLVVGSTLFVSGTAVLLAIENVLFPNLPVPRVTSRFTLVKLATDLVAIPVLGLIAGCVVHGRSRVWAQVIAIWFLHGIVEIEVAHLAGVG